MLPQDRIIPFLGGGSLLRSSTLPATGGVVVALGAAPVELVVATDVSAHFLQVTTDPMFVFRVYEKIVLRIKEPDAIVSLCRAGINRCGGCVAKTEKVEFHLHRRRQGAFACPHDHAPIRG